MIYYKGQMKTWHIYRWAGAVIAAALAMLAPALARADSASSWFTTDQGKVRLIAAQPGVGDASAVSLGLEFQLAPHWKIYWRAPGDAGYPPHLDWTGSKNLASADIEWPAPERFSVQGLETVGYTGAVVLPITARLAQAGAPLHLQAHLEYLTCREICIPYEANLTLDLAVTGSGNGYDGLIAQYRALVPGDGKAAGLALESAVLRGGNAPVLELRVKSEEPLAAPDVFVETPRPGVAFGAPMMAAEKAGETMLRLPVSGRWQALIGQKLGITLVDGARTMSGSIVPIEGADVADLATLATMLGFALLGGLILNLMPCVLPVLALKLLAAFPRNGDSVAGVRRGFLASAAGVIISFLVLGLASLGLKLAGIAVGWGMQFQNPLFLVFLIAVLTLFACNLWGFFEVPLPRTIAALGERAPLGSFATGAFATLLAIPCSAPFLGTALGFALTEGPREIIAIFLMLGVGMALPYLLVAAVPRIAMLLPRPGKWMRELRRVLGVLLAGSALWLVWVLGGEIGAQPALVVAALMLCAGFALGFVHEAMPRRATLAIALLAALLVPQFAPRTLRGETAADGRWQRFDPAAISALVRDGHVVFVDVTADWCLTCKVNERLVLDGAAVQQALDQPGVIAMRADWTRPNPAIAAYLSRFGRYGIPFNSVYGPAAPSGIALPELLTPGIVTAALTQAAGASP
jgi:suppressor for copper-sensitivity B